VILIHFNNGAFGWIKALQKLHANEKYFSVDFNPNDPVKVAQGFGLEARAVTTPDELDQALEEAFSLEGPVFIDVMRESEAEEYPPVYSWLKAAENRPE